MSEKKVLIIRLSAMGDVIFTLPLANVLKNAGYKVSWLVSEKGIELLKNNPTVDDVILVPNNKWKKQNFFKNFFEYINILKYLRNEKFDIAIDTQMLFKTFIWTKFCGAKRRIVSKSAREFAIFGGNEIIEKLYFDWNSHVTQDYLKYAKYLNLEISNPIPILPASDDLTKNYVQSILKDVDKSKQTIVIAPATTWKAKHWDKDYWKELIKLLKNDYNLVFTGGCNDNELIKYISDGIGINLSGKTNILELCELFRNVDLLISLDSGSTHLAWATQVPKIVSIFCCTPQKRYQPIGASNKYIALTGNLECQPCHRKKCPLKSEKNLCTKFPRVEEVYKAVEELMLDKVNKR